MRSSPDQMDAILAELTPTEAPEFLRAIELFERCGILPPEEAVEWRKRFGGWVEFRFGIEEGDETGPVS